MNLEKYEQIKKDQEILEKQIFVADDCIMINVYREYSIALFRCNTPGKILWWVKHLTEKTWVNNQVMNRFIELACKENSIVLDKC